MLYCVLWILTVSEVLGELDWVDDGGQGERDHCTGLKYFYVWKYFYPNSIPIFILILDFPTSLKLFK